MSTACVGRRFREIDGFKIKDELEFIFLTPLKGKEFYMRFVLGEWRTTKNGWEADLKHNSDGFSKVAIISLEVVT